MLHSEIGSHQILRALSAQISSSRQRVSNCGLLRLNNVSWRKVTRQYQFLYINNLQPILVVCIGQVFISAYVINLPFTRILSIFNSSRNLFLMPSYRLSQITERLRGQCVLQRGMLGEGGRGDLTKSQVTNFSRNAPEALGCEENYTCLSWSAPIYVVTRI